MSQYLLRHPILLRFHTLFLGFTIFLQALLCSDIDICIFPHTDDDNEHLRLGTDEAVDDSQAIAFQLDFQESGRIAAQFMSERFTILAFGLWKRVLPDFPDALSMESCLLRASWR